MIDTGNSIFLTIVSSSDLVCLKALLHIGCGDETNSSPADLPSYQRNLVTMYIFGGFIVKLANKI